jgi:NAD(P)-dependent dehydrogenase (short-subunit alcohol dehydrogenase family)
MGDETKRKPTRGASGGTAHHGQMEHRTVVVTGATSGIGRAAAEGLARLGATLLLVARDQGRGEQTIVEIEQIAAPPPELYVADLSSQRSIRGLAADLRARHERLDVLVNNAGPLFGERRLSEDGLEMTFALNHLGYFLFASELLALRRAGAPARIVKVASAAGNRGHIDFDDLQGERSYSGWRAYGQSKLANILFTRELARRLAGTGVTVNAVHPGFVATNFGNAGSRSYRLVQGLGSPWRRTPEEGADTVIYLASSPQVEGVSGEYFADRKPARSSPEARDDAAARRLWQISEVLVAERPAGRSEEPAA